MAVYKKSRFSLGNNIYHDKQNDVPYMEFPDMEIPIDNNDLVYQIKAGEDIEFLANKFYGDPLLKWAILYANPSYMSELDINVGDYLNIPRQEKVVRFLNGR